MRRRCTMRQALEHPDLFGRVLEGDSWAAWRALLIATMGEELSAEERALYRSLTGRETEPGEMVEEFWAVVGRRGGKTRAIAVLATYLAALCDWRDVLAPGERATIPIMAASMKQAKKAFSYIGGIFQNVPRLAKLVERETDDVIGLSTRIDIEVSHASWRTIRSITAVAAICDEIAFWHIEGAANPDAEILGAVRPTLATTGGPLVVISSPHARKGELFEAYKAHHGAIGDRLIVVAKGASRTFNPSLPQRVIERAYAKDPAKAKAEYGGEFRTDVESFITRDVVEACVEAGCRERAPEPRKTYTAFVDPSGGRSDPMTLAIAHAEGRVAVLDAVREVKPEPTFNPGEVVAEFARVLKSYGITRVKGDRYAGEWPAERFREHGITYVPSDLSKSEIYQAFLPVLNSRTCRLLDDERFMSQVTDLERQVGRGGRESIDHPRGKNDDRANAVAGAIVNAGTARPSIVVTSEVLARAKIRPTAEYNHTIGRKALTVPSRRP